MKKMQIISALILITALTFTTFISNIQTSAQTKYKICGYILNSDGQPIGGADIIFNVPQTVPGYVTNASGYYEMNAPAGTYHVNVWPPYNSHYLNYDESAYTVNSDTTRNITLQTGYKVSGYVTNATGAPMVGAVVFLDNYGSGYFTNSQGYYFLAVPTGTYRIDAHPRIGTFQGPTSQFLTYIENDFQVTADIVKNITVNQQVNPTANPTTNPTDQTNPTTNPTQNPNPTPTSTPNLPPTHITIQTDASNYNIGSKLTVTGTLTNQNGAALSDKTVILSYTLEGSSQWVEVGSAKTNTAGQYSIQWLVSGSGSFTLKATYAGDGSQAGAQDTTMLSFLPYQEHKVFFVESNSTVTELSFNSESLALGFIVSGETGTAGYTKVTVAKTLAENFTEFSVSIDKTPVVYSVTSSGEYWIIEFTYHHSTHEVTVALDSEAQKPATLDLTMVLASLVLVIAVVAVAGVIVVKRHKK